MRVVIDTNVVVSALIVPGSVPDQVMRFALAGKFTWLVDSRILAEYENVLRRPGFAFSTGAIERILVVARNRAEPIIANPLALTLPDPSDLPFIEVAASGGADAIVTGNAADFRPAEGRIDVHVVAPRAFLDFFARRPR